MKTKYFFLFIALLISTSYSSQNIGKEYEQIKGTWKGNFEEKNNSYAVTLEISKNMVIKSSYNFILTNFTNDKFHITKSEITENQPKIITINIENAGLTSCEQCKFTKGKVIIKILNDKTINLSVISVGPSYWPMNDVEEGMTDVADLKLTKID